jgi:hypothetical protein
LVVLFVIPFFLIPSISHSIGGSGISESESESESGSEYGSGSESITEEADEELEETVAVFELLNNPRKEVQMPVPWGKHVLPEDGGG